MTSTSHHIYTSRFESTLESPFWNLISQTFSKDSSSAQLIVPTTPLKDHLLSRFKFPKSSVLTLDEVIIKHGGIPIKNDPISEMYTLEKIVDRHPNQIGPSQNTPGFLKQLHQFILESYRNHFDPSDYKRLEANTQKAEFITTVRDEFVETLKELNYSSPLLGYEAALKEPSLKEFCSQKHLFFCGFWDIPNLQKNCIQLMLNHCKSSSWFIHYDADNVTYQLSEGLVSWLHKECPQILHIPCTKSPTTETKITTFSYPSSEDELYSVCQFIKQKVEEDLDLNYSDISVIVPSIQTYQHPLLELLFQHNIPSRSAPTAPLKALPLGQFIVSLLSYLSRPTAEQFRSLQKCPYLQKFHYAPDTLDPASFWVQFPELDSLTRRESVTDILQSILTLISREDPDYVETNIHSTIERLIDTMTEFKLTTLSLKEGLNFILTALSATDIPLNEGSPSGVAIYGKFTSYLIKSKLIIMMGSNEGQWPAYVAPNCCISSQAREFFGWPDTRTYYQWDEWLFLSAMTSAQTIHMTRTSDSAPSHLIQTYSNHYGHHVTQEERSSEQHTLHLEPAHRHFTPTFQQPENPYNPEHWSATQLERYQSCPLRFYYSTVLEIPDQITSDNDVDPGTWGTLIHCILHDYYSHPNSKKGVDKETKRHTLTDIGKAHFDSYADSSFKWQIKWTQLFGGPHQRGLCDAIIENDDQSPFPFEPSEFELPFDITLQQNSTPIRIKGQIDLVLTSGNAVILVDHKSGKSVPTGADIKQFRSLQLPLYYYSYTQMNPNRAIFGAMINHVANAYTTEKKWLMASKEAKEESIIEKGKRPFIIEDGYFAQLHNHIHKIIEKIWNQNYDPSIENSNITQSNRQKSCSNCPYTTICHYDKRELQLT